MASELLVYLEPLLKLILAALLSGLIGLDREKKGLPAGLRTYMLVCVASTLATVASIDFFPNPDSLARIAAGLITGIGFLGAGSIMVSQNHVRGLTTAAGIWTMCILGMAVGMGMYPLSIGFSIIVYLILKLKFVEDKYKNKAKLSGFFRR